MIDLQKLMNTSSMERFAGGSVIIRDGGTDTDSMYIMLQGEVCVYKNFGKPNEVLLNTLSAGNFFGEMSLFLNKERTADVVAKSDVVALKIDRLNAYDFFEQQPEATYSLIRTLCARIDEDNQRRAGKSAEPAAPAETPPSSFFPEGHGDYNMPVAPPDPGLTYAKNYQCPFCLQKFTKLALRQSALQSLPADNDLRPRYKGIEALHFEVLSCPSCYLSAFTSQFEKAQTSKENLLFEILSPHRGQFDLSGDMPRDVQSLFAGFYFALLCAPVCFPRVNMGTARLWHRISWLYGDCGDGAMRIYAEREALKLYTKSYENDDLPDDQLPRIQIILGELNFRAGDFKAASDYFLKVKMNRNAGGAYTRIAENRANDIKEARKK